MQNMLMALVTREFVSPEVFGEIKLQMDERGNAPRQTDVVALNAELLKVAPKSGRHVASVHFSGMIRQSVKTPVLPFSEIWNLSKATGGNIGWVVSGIQPLG